MMNILTSRSISSSIQNLGKSFDKQVVLENCDGPLRVRGKVVESGLSISGKVSLKTHELKDPSSPQQIRTRLNLTQAAFAGLMGVSLRTVQDWEQGRREPSGPAKSLLRIAQQHPEVFIKLA